MTTAAPRREPGTDISPQQIEVYRLLHHADRDDTWLTNADIHTTLVADGIHLALSTVRKITGRLHGVGVLQRRFVHPSMWYRLETEGYLVPRARDYRDRLREAADALGLPIDTATEAAP